MVEQPSTSINLLTPLIHHSSHSLKSPEVPTAHPLPWHSPGAFIARGDERQRGAPQDAAPQALALRRALHQKASWGLGQALVDGLGHLLQRLRSRGEEAVVAVVAMVQGQGLMGHQGSSSWEPW